uniref:Sugar transport protein 5 n=1 Tax=Aegilops tauschii TaxID=37682 RepID=N1R5B3_AEGTA
MAASGGLIFGYDIGISGGVTAMESFLEEFFPGVLRRMAAARRDQYCVYDSHVLTAFTSSLYLAGVVASLAAGRVTRAVGRQAVMLAGGAFFFAGAAVNAAAVNIAMLIVGRMLLGFGIGFTNQAAPVYLAETAPAKWRGAFTTGFQLFLGIGNLAANLTNYGAARIPRWGWRLSLGLAAVPAAVIFVGALLIPDTPSSLIVRGRVEQARAALRRTAGFGSNAALMGAVILGAVNLGSALVSVATVDRYGRRPLFLAGGLVMIMCQVAVAWIMGSQIGRDGESAMARKYSVAVLALTCVFSASFGWSWGPLTWVIPGEIFPVEVRSAGQGISVAVNLGATFVLTQTFLSMLCSFNYALREIPKCLVLRRLSQVARGGLPVKRTSDLIAWGWAGAGDRARYNELTILSAEATHKPCHKPFLFDKLKAALRDIIDNDYTEEDEPGAEVKFVYAFEPNQDHGLVRDPAKVNTKDAPKQNVKGRGKDGPDVTKNG